MADIIPKLPAEISPDGREIWDWAAQLSKRRHLVTKAKNLAEDIRYIRRCGACQMWMTKKCPREVHSNKTGRWTGPSMKADPCPSYAERPSETARRTKLQQELADVAAQLNGQAA